VRESLKNYRRYLTNHESALPYAVPGLVGGVASGLVVLAFELASRATGRQILHGVATRESIEKFTLDRL